jgi:Xaa-Pro aminopeptidase
MTDRLTRFGQVLQQEGIDCYLACTPTSMGYLSGLFEDGHERLLLLAVNQSGQPRLICPGLSVNQARRIGIEDIRSWEDGENPMVHIGELADDWNLKSGIIGVDNEMRSDILLALQDKLAAALFKPGDPFLSQLARRKDSSELERMQRAADIADEAYRMVKPRIREGQTELEVGEMLSTAMSELGGRPTFCIVASGPNGAEPHHLNDDTKLRRGDIVILDFGCDYQRYQSDITRVVAVGEASEKSKQVYGTVWRAHMAARELAKPGVTSGAVDAAARKVIEDAGYGKYFIHRTGHGIGMKGHEYPNITPGSDFVLEEGNCFSVEPGIYLPGEFGVRIENIVALRSSGCYSFNEEPSNSLEIVG